MELGKYVIILFVLFSLATAPPPSETKQFRADYEYNKKTDAFYKLHTESKFGFFVKDLCEVEGAKLMSPDYQDIVQAHGMRKKYPDLGPYVWIASDGATHESAEEQPLIDLTPYSDEEETRHELFNCDVLMTDGEVKKLECDHRLPFICKVSANDAPYDSRCDVYATGYHYYPEVQSCYKVSDTALVWNEAYEECRTEGTHLVIINSQAEHDLIKNLTNSAKPVQYSHHSWYFLAGFRAIKPSREFRTIFNQTLEEAGYSKWTYPEPNNLGNDEYCGSVFKDDGDLNDVNCIHKFAFICEKEVHN